MFKDLEKRHSQLLSYMQNLTGTAPVFCRSCTQYIAINTQHTKYTREDISC